MKAYHRRITTLLLTTLAAVLLAAAPCSAGGAKRPRGPVGEIGRLLARNPRARIAIVQGSFDWVHKGHLEMISAAASGKKRDGSPNYDLVVVVPSYEYSKKPFLKASFGRRLGLMRAAVAEASLGSRVVVSNATQKLGSRPAVFIENLAKAYPGAQISYVLGGDSYNESAGWPGFERALRDNGVELRVAKRPGTKTKLRASDRALPKRAGTEISSTEIRDALQTGQLESVAKRLPSATLAALRQAASHGGDSSAGPNRDLVVSANGRMPRVKRELAVERQRLDRLRLEVNAKGIDPRKGYTDKLMMFGRDSAGRIRSHYLFKKLSHVDAKKEESLTVLANLVGMRTPLALQHTYQEPGARYTHAEGVILRWKPGLRQAGVNYDFAKASHQVGEYLLRSRWFNEVIWNQDVWWGQFLVPNKADTRYQEMTNIDFGLAWVKRDPAEVQRVLKEHFKIDVPLSQTRWTSRPLKLERKVGWDPKHFDSRYTMYGPLLRDYVMGKLDLNIARVKEQLQQVKRIPRADLERALEPYIRAAKEANWGYVPIQASGGFLKADTFRDKMVERIYRSVDEYCGFLEELAAARKAPESKIYKTYAAMTGRDF